MIPALRTRERGMALIALLAVIMLGASWFLVSRLNAESNLLTAVNRQRNAEVLNKAKQALIGYIASQAAMAWENNPGAMPCPENPADFDDPTWRQGVVGTDCTTTTIGRFPWRTLGLDKLVDASGEPLWYVVGPSWGAAPLTNTVINSNSAGQLTVDGVANDAVALIIAPGRAFAVPAAAGCAAWTQVRSPVAPPDWRNYLECENATSPADMNFVTTGPSSSFNDQVVKITVGDVMPVIEAAIAKRIEREILPALQTVFVPATWGVAVGSNPVLPFAAPFANPGPGAGTSNYHGANGTYRGLLPFNQMRNCTVSATNPRCTSTVLTYSKASADVMTAGSGSIRTQSTCSWQSTSFVCTGEYLQPSISVTVTIKVENVAGGLRTLDLPDSKVSFLAMNDTAGGWGTQTIPFTKSIGLDANGDLIVTIAGGALPDIVTAGWGTYANYQVSLADTVASPIFGDHGLLSTTDPDPCPSYGCTGWFARNEWFRLLYYAVSPSNTASRLPLERSCTAAADCLSVANMTPGSRSALLVLAGRGINGVARPSAALGDYLEFGNVNAAYETRTVTPRPAAVYADTGGADAYAVAISTLATGATFQFRALNANTGTSTLNTAATGTRALVNADSSNLAAATIAANAAVEVTWDGTQFMLSKRPFNDRVVAIGSN